MSQTGLDLDQSLGYLLKQAASVLHVAMDAVLRPLGMTITHYSCLEILAQRPGLSNSELARATFVTRQSMNTLLKTMQKEGLVTRAERPSAGRILPTELTALGRQQLRSASAAVKQVEDQLRSDLTAAQRNEMRHHLQACITALA